jgi:hypothetical protein
LTAAGGACAQPANAAMPKATPIRSNDAPPRRA